MFFVIILRFCSVSQLDPIREHLFQRCCAADSPTQTGSAKVFMILAEWLVV